MVYCTDGRGKRSLWNFAEARGDHFGGYHEDPAPAFEEHRHSIEKIAAKLIADGRFETDGAILIRSRDVYISRTDHGET